MAAPKVLALLHVLLFARQHAHHVAIVARQFVQAQRDSDEHAGQEGQHERNAGQLLVRTLVGGVVGVDGIDAGRTGGGGFGVHWLAIAGGRRNSVGGVTTGAGALAVSLNEFWRDCGRGFC